MTLYERMLPLIPSAPEGVKSYLSRKFAFSDQPFQPEAERILKIGQPINGVSAQRVKANQSDFRAKLRQDLTDHFSEEELRTLCFDMRLDYESLPAQGKAGKAREIVAQVERNGAITKLIKEFRLRCPNVQWMDMPEKNSDITTFPGDSVPERILNGDLVVKFRAAEFRRNASGEYHYTGRTIRAVTFDLSEDMPGVTRAWMTLYVCGALPFALAIVRAIGYDFPLLRVSIDELCADLEGLCAQADEPTVKHEPETTTELNTRKRRRGRLPADSQEIKRICEGWFAVQWTNTQDAYCAQRGIGVSTLRGWLRRYENERLANS